MIAKQLKQLLKQANKLKKEGKAEEALLSYLEVLETKPNCIPALAEIVSLYIQSKQWDKVVEFCQSSISSHPENWSAYLNLAQALKEKKDFNKAIEVYQNFLSLKSNLSIQVYIDIGNFLGKQGHLEKQIFAYCKAIELHSELLLPHQKLAQLLIESEKLEILAKTGLVSETINFYQKLLSLPVFLDRNAANIDRIHYRLGSLVLKQSIRCGKFSQAVSFFRQACESNPVNAWYPYHLGNCLRRQGYTDEALTFYQRALEARPNFADAHIEIGIVFSEKKEWHEAFYNMLKALEIQPNRGEIHSFFAKHFHLAKKHLPSEEFEHQVTAYNKVINTIKNLHNTIIVQVGRTLVNAEKVSEAIELNKKACLNILQKDKPNYVKVYWKNGNFTGPNFFIIGVMKCGTTALYDYMVQHPRILPSVLKEHNGFGLAQNIGEKFNYYLSLFPPLPSSGNFITGEASTTYMSSPTVPNNMFKYFPNAKLIVILRNPVKRAISQYYFRLDLQRGVMQRESLENALNLELQLLERESNFSENLYRYINNKSSIFLIHGLYVYFLEKWMSVFSREQFLILKSEDLGKSSATVMSQVFEFLGFPDYQKIQYPLRNRKIYPSQIDDALLIRLQKFYQPHNQRLEEFLGQKFHWD